MSSDAKARFSILKFVPIVLKEREGERLTARQIAEIVMQKFPVAVENKRRNSQAVRTPLDSDDAMISQIVAEIGSQRHAILSKEPRIRTLDERPRKFFYSENSDLDEV